MNIFRKQGKNLLLGVLFIFVLFGNNRNLVAKDICGPQNSMHEKTKKSKIVFLITKDPNNYEADKTVPVFAKMLDKKYVHDVIVLLGSAGHGSYNYPDMEKVS